MNMNEKKVRNMKVESSSRTFLIFKEFRNSWIFVIVKLDSFLEMNEEFIYQIFWWIYTYEFEDSKSKSQNWRGNNLF